MQFLRTVRLDRKLIPADPEPYPWSLPVVQSLDTLSLTTPVTMFVGQNGSGKSTLLEAIAVSLGLNAEGGTQNFNFATQATHSPLHEALQLGRGGLRPQTQFFLRAESIYMVATQLEEYDTVSQRYGGLFPDLPPLTDSYGGRSLHEQSHGESFLSIVTHRLGDRGLYLMDEAESALSPQGLLALIRRIHELVRAGSQLIIATHSPMLLAYPDAAIYEIAATSIALTDYRDTDHYRLTRAFLENPDAFLKRLFDDD